MKPLHELFHNEVHFYWKNELDTQFQQIKKSIRNGVNLTLPKANHPFFITVDSSLIGIGCVIIRTSTKKTGCCFSCDSWSYN